LLVSGLWTELFEAEFEFEHRLIFLLKAIQEEVHTRSPASFVSV